MASSAPHIVLLAGGDWNAIYVDGTLREQGHLDLAGVELGLSIARSSFDHFTVAEEWLTEQGHYPRFLSDVVITDPSIDLVGS